MSKRVRAYTPTRPMRKTRFPDNYVIACSNCPAWVQSTQQRYADKRRDDNTGENIVTCPVCKSDMAHFKISVEKYMEQRVNTRSVFPFGQGWSNHPVAYIKRMLP